MAAPFARPPVVNDAGLICGFRLHPQRGPEAFDWSDVSTAMSSGTVWLHFNLADVRARDWIAA